MVFKHIQFIEDNIQKPIHEHGILKIANNLNEFINLKKANEYALNYSKHLPKNENDDKSRQEKSSKDSILSKLVEEIIIYLLMEFFKVNKYNYFITNQKNENEIVKYITDCLKIYRNTSSLVKTFDADIVIYNEDSFKNDKKVFIISAKGTTRERIGQFLSHLFLMDKDVLDAKYGENRYTVVFSKENITLKYAFVTLDWAEHKDFIKISQKGRLRKSMKETEVRLILDDLKLGGGIYVLNNLDNFDGIGNFSSLVGKICEFLK